MKTRLDRLFSRFFWMSLWALTPTAGSLRLAAGGPPGALDVSFAPPAEYQQAFYSMSVIDRRLYVSGSLSSFKLARLQEDGSPDTGWGLHSPVQGPVVACMGTPAGGTVVSSFGGTFSEQADGTFARISYAGNSRNDSLYPQADGSLTMNLGNLQLTKLDAEGRSIPTFGLNSRLTPVSFVNPGGRSSIGGGSAWSAQDGHGRIIVAGNFMSAGGLERLGLARVLTDGRPDPNWNPGPALGIALTNSADPNILTNLSFTPPTNFLTVMPIAVSAGTNDSVIVAVEYVSSAETFDQRMAIISADGGVTSVFPDYSRNGTATRIVQPDGRILIGGGYFTNWDGVPVSNLIRLNPDGSLDPSFQVHLEPPTAMLTAMALDELGRLWISGEFSAVNGTPQKGLARVFAYDPTPEAPTLEAAATHPRIGTNEVLQLTATVRGVPPPSLQWYRDGVPLPGATNRGLRLPVTPDTALGEFHLAAWSSLGTNELSFGTVVAAQRSPRPGSRIETFAGPLTNVPGINQLIPLPDGRVLFGAGTFGASEVRTLVGRLTADGKLDPQFGVDGVVSGEGRSECIRALPDGHILVAGTLTQLGGSPASGLAELDADGRRVPRNFPTLDVPSLTSVLRLDDGRYVLAGRFNRVGDLPVFRLARLHADLTPDASFNAAGSFEPWQVVDSLTLDAQNRLLAAGAGLSFEGSLTNPALFGLVRLREDGSADPTFQRVTSAVREVFVESGGTLVAGMPLRRWGTDGQLVTRFQMDSPIPGGFFETDHRLVRLPDGRVVYPIGNGISDDQPTRWLPDGRIDDGFQSPFDRNEGRIQITAAAALVDESLLLAMVDLKGATWIRRLLPDSDRRLRNPGVVGGDFTADLFTQPGHDYQVHRRTALNAGPASPVAAVTGDGYRSEIVLPAKDTEGFFELRRDESGTITNP